MVERPTKPHDRQKIGTLVADQPFARIWRGHWRLAQPFHGIWLHWFSIETDARRLFLWLPVGLMIGVLLYTSADQEPHGLAGVGLTLVLCGLIWAQRHHHGLAYLSLVFLASISFGFSAATLQTVLTSKPVLTAPYFGYVTGWIEEIDERAGSVRMILRVESLYVGSTIDPADRPAKPARIRVTYSGPVSLKAGDRIRSATRLQPPPGPAVPGGYDFRFDSFFKQIGGVGSLNGTMTILRPPNLSFAQRFWTGLDNLRNHITRRITSSVGGQEGAVGAALVTGKRGTIDDTSNDILRAAGIYHVISISGLHMAIAAGFAFTTARLILLLIPGLALRSDIRRWSALAGVCGAVLYDLFAGSDIATERSMLMSVVFFGAILAGRRLLSMRNWAVAAIILVVLEPQGVLNPGFQMSFAAVAALIALYEKRPNLAGFEVNHQNVPQLNTPKPVLRAQSSGPVAKLVHGAWTLCVDIVLTTLVAEMATAQFGLFHFHMIQTYGIVGNAITLPFVSLIVMPAAFIGMFLLPFGWDAPVWQIMGFGVQGILDISKLIASWPHATLILAGFGAGPLLWLTAGLAFLTLWISPIRWIGCAGLLIGGVLMFGSAHHEDVLIGREAKFMAVRGPDDRLTFAGRGINRFSLQHYLHEDGDARQITHPDLVKPAACDKTACTLPMRDGRPVILLLAHSDKAAQKSKTTKSKSTDDTAPKRQWLETICKTAAVIIAPDQTNLDMIRQARSKPARTKTGKNRSTDQLPCQALVITPELIRQQGPLSLKSGSDGAMRITTNNQASWSRPWAPKPKPVAQPILSDAGSVTEKPNDDQ